MYQGAPLEPLLDMENPKCAHLPLTFESLSIGARHADDDSPCLMPVECSYVRLVWFPNGRHAVPPWGETLHI